MKFIKITLISLAAVLLALTGCAGQTDREIAAPKSSEAHLSKTVDVKPDNQTIRTIGRTHTEDGVTWLPQSGSAIEFKVTGRSVELELAGDKSVNNEPDLQPRFAVLVDGDVVLDDTLGEPTRTVKVFSEEKTRVAVVEVIHLSEAKRGSVGLKKITVESEESTPVTPTDDRSMRIEFIGDSITCAYGVEGNVGETSFKTTTENFMKSYAYLTAKKLNADYSTVCYSGYGVVSGWSADGSRQDKMLVPPLYDLVDEKSGKPWDHMSYDYIIINLGTNDYSYTGNDKERMEEFSNGYEAFLTQVHKEHPNSKIICLYGSMGGHELYPYIEKAVKNKTEVKSFLLDEIDIAKAGTNGHPNTADQQEIANRLVEIIQNGRI